MSCNLVYRYITLLKNLPEIGLGSSYSWLYYSGTKVLRRGCLQASFIAVRIVSFLLIISLV